MEERTVSNPRSEAAGDSPAAGASTLDASLAGLAAQIPIPIGAVIGAGTAVLSTAFSAVQLGLQIQKNTQATTPEAGYPVQVFEFRNHKRAGASESDPTFGIVMYVESYETTHCKMGEVFVVLRPGESDVFTVFPNPDPSSGGNQVVIFTVKFYSVIDKSTVEDTLSLTLTYDNDPNSDNGWYMNSDIWETGSFDLPNTQGKVFMLGSETLGGTSCIEIVPADLKTKQ